MPVDVPEKCIMTHANEDAQQGIYDCLDRACFIAETNECGVKDGTVVQLLESAEDFFEIAASTPNSEPFSIMGPASIHETRGERTRALST
jgi:hypothetical protein